MNPHIMEVTPMAVVGYPSRHRKDHVRSTGDAPAFWDTIQMDYGTMLTKLHGWYFDGKLQEDIYVPIRQREEAVRWSMERGRY